ncbi:MAG: IPT/TIG domain-containing protein [Nitrospiraceae bacterium]
MFMRLFFLALLAVSVALMAHSLPTPTAQAEQGSNVEGTGFSLFDTESIKGFDATKVEKDPVCDRSKRPKIMKVEPDEAKPGDKVLIKGENFGTKECFHGVTFSAASKEKVDYKFVNDSTLEATVPQAKAGMSFIIVVAGGGSAQSKPVLIKTK